MKLAIMQPYFFPYPGYFGLIKQTDMFILFDAPQYIRHGWIERNRILKQTGGWQYIRVPLEKHSRETKINDIRINNSQGWKEKILAQFQHYKKIAPNYYQVTGLLKELFTKDFSSITALDFESIKLICEYLGIQTTIKIRSLMNLTVGQVNAPDEWALNICKEIGNVSEYWNPYSGISFFDRSKYDSNQIVLKFYKPKINEYDQRRPSFEPGLSILDVMMFNKPEDIKKMLDQYEIF